jgi:hypothetical protein
VNLFSDLARTNTARLPRETSRIPDRDISRIGEKPSPPVGMDASQMKTAIPSINVDIETIRMAFCMAGFYSNRMEDEFLTRKAVSGFSGCEKIMLHGD